MCRSGPGLWFACPDSHIIGWTMSQADQAYRDTRSEAKLIPTLELPGIYASRITGICFCLFFFLNYEDHLYNSLKGLSISLCLEFHQPSRETGEI